MRFDTFKGLMDLSEEDMYRDLFVQNREEIQIKKEKTAIKNLALIFDAALFISNEKGFSSMSLRDLSAKTGLSMGAMYSYISSKDKLLDMMHQYGRSMVLKVLIESLDGIDDPKKQLETTIQTHLYLSEFMQPWFYFSYMETKNLHKDLHKKAIESELFTEQIFVDIMEKGISKQIFHRVDARLTASLLKAMLQDWYLKRWKYKDRGVKVEEYSDFVIDILSSYLYF
ncbi:MAG: TetR/AcrR family transcriptional regulator [Thermodesulfobacteriota bacterium]|nr:TetR/AcrR family transcriptional regulator [Thermodesulfobacteriota bacterium]